MKISAEDASRAAALACLELSGEELLLCTDQLNTILEHFAKLLEVNTYGTEPFVHAGETLCAFRDDIRCPSLSADEALHNAPESARAFFSVPRVIET